jgi:hypothetical protein
VTCIHLHPRLHITDDTVTHPLIGPEHDEILEILK